MAREKRTYKLQKAVDNLPPDAGNLRWEDVSTDRPLTGLADAMKYIREKKLAGSFTLVAVVAELKPTVDTVTRIKF